MKHIPRHVAVIQDGNRRFARDQGLNTAIGHRRGADTTEEFLDWACDLGVRHITLYTFSTENFRRDREELSSLFTLFQEKFLAIIKDERVHRNHIRVQMIGDRTLLPDDLLATIDAAEEATREYADYYINVALAYGGRNEIVRAVRRIMKDGLLPEAIDEDVLPRYLDTSFMPDPDLLIRTGGERRISNYLLWQLAYTEIYFSDILWPDFDESALDAAISWFSTRQRRFGMTPEQVEGDPLP